MPSCVVAHCSIAVQTILRSVYYISAFVLNSARTARRRARKKNANAPWADDAAIKALYKDCKDLTEKTGIKHEVDHIYPLQSPYMCGLHVETNLQILPESDNNKKGNRTWPGQLDCQRLPIDQNFTPEQIALAAKTDQN